MELPTVQRSVVILKDVLDQSLEEIAAMLDLTVNAVKAHLAWALSFPRFRGGSESTSNLAANRCAKTQASEALYRATIVQRSREK
jgi:Sigma-70, region 4